MPKWLTGTVGPTLSLWLYIVAMAVVAGLTPTESALTAKTDLAARIALPLILAAWVSADARKRGRGLCYDYDTFVFLAWPVVVPVYLFRTRGHRGWYTLFCFAGLWCLYAIVAAALRSIFALQQ